MFIIYVNTFMLFPAITFKKEFSWDLTFTWKIQILILIFNIFDTIGKYVSKYVDLGVVGSSVLVYSR